MEQQRGHGLIHSNAMKKYTYMYNSLQVLYIHRSLVYSEAKPLLYGGYV